MEQGADSQVAAVVIAITQRHVFTRRVRECRDTRAEVAGYHEAGTLVISQHRAVGVIAALPGQLHAVVGVVDVRV